MGLMEPYSAFLKGVFGKLAGFALTLGFPNRVLAVRPPLGNPTMKV